MNDLKRYDLVEEFEGLLKTNPLPKRYITAARLALRKYQQDTGVTIFADVDQQRLLTHYRGIGPQTLQLLNDLYQSSGK